MQRQHFSDLRDVEIPQLHFLVGLLFVRNAWLDSGYRQFPVLLDIFPT